MMRPIWPLIILAISVGIALDVSGAQTSGVPDSAADYRATLNRYCVTCHNEKLKTAGLLLDKVDIGDVSEGAPVWEKVVRKLRTRSMPPAGAPRPDTSFYDSFSTFLETSLDRAAEAKPNPGRPALHRLNRTEYVNAIRDLLALEVDGRSILPADDAGYGFDNIADALSVSPTLLERYVSAATQISRLAIGDRGTSPAEQTYTLPDKLRQDDRVSEELPFGSRGGTAIRYHFSLDGEYSIKIGLRRDSNSYIFGLQEGLGEPHQLEVSVDGVRVTTFSLGGERKGRKRTVDSSASDGDEQDPEIKKYELTADEKLTARFPASAGTRNVTVAFVRPEKREGILRPLPFQEHPRATYKGGDPDVASVTIGGPYKPVGLGETRSRQKIFLCHPAGDTEDIGCARKILSSLARQAFRRPVTDADVQPLVELYKTGNKDGGFESGIELALERILITPEFLFRIESDPVQAGAAIPRTAYRIGDLDLASRLSFFLWSSIPDEQLLELAVRGKLKDHDVLQRQVRRMFADSRSGALINNFAGQWLLLRNMEQVIPDRELYEEFDDNLRQAFEKETLLFFESMLREDHSVLDLLDANYTFVNERLAQHYGIPDIHGSNFRRVTVTDENRRGLLGQGSLLTLTSYPTRTSVVLRGKWLLENILGTPPPPPPPNVPPLKERASNGKILSVRQQMEEHRANAVCAGCHSRMDPLGFALENFDAIGKWRATEGVNNTPIDSTGALIDGTKFQGAAGLRKVLLNQPEQFVTTVTEKLLTYALGRTLTYSDAPAVREIVRAAASNNYRWSSLIFGIIDSTPFQMRSVGLVPMAAANAQAENRRPQP